MGSDIHAFVEEYRDGQWVFADNVIEEEVEGRIHYSQWGPDGRIGRFPGGRNYNLFAILANVRNGCGFAGIRTGAGFVPISQPRGLPADASALVCTISVLWGRDAHSHSWLTLREIIDYDWTQTTSESYNVPKSAADHYRATGEVPRGIASFLILTSGPTEIIETQTTYEDAVGKPVIDAIRGITDNPDATRVIFWFDN